MRREGRLNAPHTVGVLLEVLELVGGELGLRFAHVVAEMEEVARMGGSRGSPGRSSQGGCRFEAAIGLVVDSWCGWITFRYSLVSSLQAAGKRPAQCQLRSALILSSLSLMPRLNLPIRPRTGHHMPASLY